MERARHWQKPEAASATSCHRRKLEIAFEATVRGTPPAGSESLSSDRLAADSDAASRATVNEARVHTRVRVAQC